MAALVLPRDHPAEYFSVLLDLGDDSETPLFADEAQFKRFFRLVDAPLERSRRRACRRGVARRQARFREVMDLRGAIAALPSAACRHRRCTHSLPWPDLAIGLVYTVESWPEEWAPPRDKEAAKECSMPLVAVTEDDTDTPTVAALRKTANPPSASSASTTLPMPCGRCTTCANCGATWPRVETGPAPRRSNPPPLFLAAAKNTRVLWRLSHPRGCLAR